MNQHFFEKHFYLTISLLVLSGCANQPAQNYAEHQKPGAANTSNAHHAHEACEGTALQCAKTVTATFDEKGVLWISYVHDKHLFVQSSKDNGQTFNPAIQVNQTPEDVTARDESRPKIKVYKDNIYLTWTTGVPNAKQRHNGDIRFSRSVDGGKTFSSPVTINDEIQSENHRFDSLAIGKKGEIFITWLDGRDVAAAKQTGKEFDGSSVYYTWSNDGGAHFYSNKLLAAHSCQCCRLQSEIAPDNTPVVLWRHVFEGSIRDHALNKFKDWNTPGEVSRVSYENWKIDACPHHGAGLSIAENGTYHATWFSNSPTQQGLFYGYSKDQGKTFSKSFNFAQQGAGHPHVLTLGKYVYIVWQEFDGKQTHIKLLTSKDDGLSWDKPKAIAKTDKTADHPFLVRDGKHVYLSWKIASQDFHLQSVE